MMTVINENFLQWALLKNIFPEGGLRHKKNSLKKKYKVNVFKNNEKAKIAKTIENRIKTYIFLKGNDFLRHSLPLYHMV